MQGEWPMTATEAATRCGAYVQAGMEYLRRCEDVVLGDVHQRIEAIMAAELGYNPYNKPFVIRRPTHAPARRPAAN